MPSDYLTIKGAAALLGLSPRTVQTQIRRGRLAAEKFGRDWMISRSEVERYKRESLGLPGRKPMYTNNKNRDSQYRLAQANTAGGTDIERWYTEASPAQQDYRTLGGRGFDHLCLMRLSDGAEWDGEEWIPVPEAD